MASRCGEVGRSRGLAVAGHLEQMRTDGVQAVVPGHSPVGLEWLECRESGPRPVHPATATAQFKVTIGLGETRSSSR